MPIRAENKHRYPSDWRLIAQAHKAAAHWACEGSPRYPECRAKHGHPHPVTGATVVLTVGHLDHRPENCAPENLRVWCQRCHNTYDAKTRAEGIAARRAGNEGME